MNKAKRVDFFAYMDDEVAELDCHKSEDGAWVPASDYDAIAADNQRLREALEKIKFRADCFVEDDADMQPHSAEVISGIARSALAANK